MEKANRMQKDYNSTKCKWMPKEKNRRKTIKTRTMVGLGWRMMVIYFL